MKAFLLPTSACPFEPFTDSFGSDFSEFVEDFLEADWDARCSLAAAPAPLVTAGLLVETSGTDRAALELYELGWGDIRSDWPRFGTLPGSDGVTCEHLSEYLGPVQ